MQVKVSDILKTGIFLFFNLFFVVKLSAATITSTTTGGVWATGSTWVGGVAPVAGDDVVIATTAGNSVTLDAPESCASLTINLNASLVANTFLLTLSGNFANSGTFTSTTGGVTLTGTASQTIAGFTTTGTVTMSKTGGVATLSGNVNAAALTINGSGGTLNMGSGRTHTFSGIVTLTAGILDGGSSTINVNATSGSAWSGTGSNFTASTSTVVFGGIAQTLVATTFYNLTLSGAGGKTFATGTTTVNGMLIVANGANANTFTGTVAYGPSATLKYSAGASNRTVSSEWPATFTASGGVIIEGTGIITLNAAKQLGSNTNVPLTISSGAILATANFGLTFHGDFINNATLSAGSSIVTITGTVGTQSISGFTTTGAVSVTKTNGTATFTSNVTAASLTINGSGGTLSLGSATHTFSGNIAVTAGTLLGATSTVVLSGNLTNAGTFTGNSFNLNITGGGTRSIAGFTTTGNVLMTKNANSTATFTGNINAGALTINGTASGRILNLGVGLTHTFTGDITLTGGTLQGGSSTLNVNSTSSTAWTGTGTLFTSQTSTVVFGGGAQTITTNSSFFNITLAGTGGKSFSSGSATTITGTMSIENGTNANSFTTAPSYTGSATLQYNAGSSNRTVGGEWIATFLGTGGVVIGGTGTITLNNNKTLGTNTAVPLTINPGATLATNNFNLTFHGNFVNNGTFTAGSSNITMAGTNVTQSIAGFTTTGLVSLTKTVGTATFTGNVTAGGLTLNGNGGTLNLGSGLSHVFAGTWTRSNGTLNGGSSSIEFSLTGTMFSGATGTFTANTGTVVFSGGGAQTCPALTYNNLTLLGSGTKTFATNPTVNGILSIEGTTAAIDVTTGVVTYGPEATLRYNKASSYTTTLEEFPASFTSTGGVIVAGTGPIVLNAAKAISYNLNINTGASVDLGTFTTHTCRGLKLGAGSLVAGEYGGTGSTAANINGTFFAPVSTGKITSASPVATWNTAALTTDWNTPGNWLEGATPTANTDAIIPGGGTQPTLTAAGICKDLTIQSGATVTTAGFQLTINGNFVNSGTAAFSSSQIVLAGLATQSIAGFTTTGTLSITKTAGTATLTGSISVGAISHTGAAGTLNLGAGLSHTVTGNIAVSASAIILANTSTVTLSGDFTNSGTFTGNGFNLVLAGTNTQSVAAFTTTGNVSMTKTSGTATFVGNVSAAALTINGSGGTLNLGSSRTHTFTGDITLSNGTLNGGTSTTFNVNASSATAWTGTGSNFTAGTGTVVFGGVAQTINTSTTFNNLTLGGTGAKTFLSGITVTINGIHTISNAANVNVFTGATIAYGASASLVYNAGASARIVSAEWPTPFTATGGITIGGTGAISLNGAKVLNDNVPLTINASAVLTPGANLLTLGGNFTRNGTLTSGAGGITLAGTATQSISGGFTTTGSITMTKTGGTATFTSGVTSALSLVINGSGGTLALGAFTHVFTSDVTLTNGTLDASSATLSVGGNFTQTSGTLTSTAMNLTITGAGTQSILGFTSSGNVSMTKTAGTATFTGDVTAGALTLNGSGGTLNLGTGRNHTFSGIVTRTNGTLDCGSSTLNLSAGGTVISGTGGTFNANNGTVNYSGAAQTVADLTYNNLTCSGSGSKTTSVSVIVNRIFSLEGTASVSAPFTYGGDATLRYNKTASYTTTTNEFPATFVAGGGVIIAGTGLISLDANKTIIAPLTINTGSKLDLSTFTGHSAKGLVLGGVNQAVGTYGGNTSSATNINATFFQTALGVISITNPLSTWLGLTTDWNTGSNWSGGVVPDSTLDVLIPSGTPQQPTLTANSSCGDLTINSGATLTTAGFQLSIYGNFVPTGTASFGNSNIRIGGIFIQTIGAITTTGTVSMIKTAGTATITGNLSANSLVINGTGGTLTLGSGLTHTFDGNITSTAGTLTGNSSNIVITGTGTQSIAGFTTTGSITCTKTGGTATFTGNISAASLTINGTGGTLDLGSGTHIFSGSISLTAGTLLGSTSSVTLAGNLSGAATFTGNDFNLTLNGTAAQSIAGFTTTGTITVTKTSGTATFTGNINSGSITLSAAGGLNFGTSLTHAITGNITQSAGTLNLGTLTTVSLTGNLVGTITGTSVNLEITGTGTQTIAALTTTRNISVTKTAGTATLGGNLSAANLTVDGVGGTLNLGPGRSHTLSGNITINDGTLACSTSTVTLSGNLTVNSPGVLDASSLSLTIAGTANQSITGFTTSGNIAMTKTAGIATLTSNLSAVNLTLNGLGGTLNLGNSLMHSFSGTWTRTNGTLNGGTSTLTFTAAGSFISGSVGSFVANGGTVNYARSGDQTVGQLTYNNLTLSGSGIKTTTGVTVNGVLSLEGSATVSTAVSYGSSSTLQYKRGGSSTTTIDEFPATFSGSGGVNIESGTVTFDASKAITGSLSISTGASVDLNGITTHTTNGLVLGGVSQSVTGTYGRTGSGATNTDNTYFAGTNGRITLSSATTTWIGLTSDWFDPANWDAGVPTSTIDAVIANTGVQPVLNNDAVCRDLTINSGATLTTANYQLTIFRNFDQNGTASLANSPIVLTGNANQNIDGFTTAGVVSVTKLGGTATLQSAIDVGGLTINGVGGTLSLGTALTHTISGDIIISAGTLAGGSSNVILAGTATAPSIGGFTTTGTVTMTKTAGTATLTGNLTAGSIVINGSGGTFNLGAGLTHTVSGDVTVTAGTLNGGSATLILSGNLSGSGTITGGAMNLTIAGGTSQNIAGITTTGAISFIKSASAATLTGNLSAGAITLNGLGGTLNMGSFTHTFSGVITLTAGTLNANSSTINENATSATAWTGSGSNFVAGTGTVVFGGAAQTINTTTTFNNLTFAGSGAKTIAGSTVTTVNGVLTIANAASVNVFTGSLVYGASATLRYNAGASNRTVSTEWPSPFTPSGGVIVDGTGIITLNAAKQIGDNTNVPLTINTGATLATANFTLTLHGDLVRTGTLSGGSSNIIVDGSVSSQSIAGFTTTGSFTLAKTTGTVTLTSGLSIGSLILNIAGSTLNLGTFTHSVGGDIVRGGASIAATAFNLSLIGTASQNIETITTTGTLTMAKTAGTATLSGIANLGSLVLNGVGGTLNTGSGLSHVVSGDITFTAGTFTGSGTIVLSGNLAGTGTFTGNATNLTLAGTSAQSIDAYTTTGAITLTKTAQVATFTGNQNASALTINGSGGTLHLGTALTHTFTGDITLTAGTLNGGSSILNANASSTSAWNGTGANFTPGTGTVVFGGNAQTIQTSTTFNNLTIQGAGAKTFANGTTTSINGVFTIANATHANIFTGATITYGSSASLLYNAGASSRTVSSEWPSVFSATGGVAIGGTGTITLDAAKQIGNNNSVALTVNSGATLATNNFGITFHGDFNQNGTFTAGSSNITLGGTLPNQTISGFTTTGDLSMTKTSGSALLAGNTSVSSILINGAGGTLDLGSGLTHTVIGNLTITSGTLNGNSANLALSGTASQSIGSLTTTGNITMLKTGGTATFTGDMDASALVVNGSGGALNLGTSRTHSFSGDIVLTAGTLNGGTGSTLNVNSSTVTAWSGTGSNFTAGTGTVSFGGGSQTIATATTFNNVTIAAPGTKTMGANITISGALDIQSGDLEIGANTLTLNGTIAGMGNANALIANGTSSAIVIGGSGALGTAIFMDQTTPGTTNRILNLTYNRSSGTMSLGNTMEVVGTVTPTAGTLAAGGNLKLISDASGTARIAAAGCTSCSYITGNVVVQRNIPSVARRWRFLGSNVQSTTLADWKNEIYITGSGGASNGFDASGSNAPSVYSYDETVLGSVNLGWVAPTNINNTLTPGKGYRVFIRGDRSDPARLTGFNASQNEVTMDLVGTPNQGDVPASLSLTNSGGGGTYVQANDGWNLVSNPYPSPYDWNAHYDNGGFHANLTPMIWVLSSGGGYLDYNASSNLGSLSGGIIPSGASFWVKANNGGTPSLTFKEQFKVGGTPVSLFKTNEGESFRIRLIADSITWDAINIKYMAGSTPNLDMYDIPKLAGTITLSAWGNDSQQLSLSVRPLTTSVDTIRLNIFGVSGPHSLEFTNSEQIAVADNVWLFDTYLSTVTDLKTTSVYNFNIVAGIPQTQGMNRFYILVGNSSALPVHLIQFSARKADKRSVKIGWSTAQELNTDRFEVERSANGTDFKSIAVVNAAGNSNKLLNYSVTDENPLRGNYYRLKQVDLDGTTTYSSVRYVSMTEVQPGSKVYPIPAYHSVTLEHDKMVTSIRVIDITGKIRSNFNVFQSLNTIDINNLETGVYVLEYVDETGQTYQEKFTKE